MFEMDIEKISDLLEKRKQNVNLGKEILHMMADKIPR